MTTSFGEQMETNLYSKTRNSHSACSVRVVCCFYRTNYFVLKTNKTRLSFDAYMHVFTYRKRIKLLCYVCRVCSQRFDDLERKSIFESIVCNSVMEWKIVSDAIKVKFPEVKQKKVEEDAITATRQLKDCYRKKKR